MCRVILSESLVEWIWQEGTSWKRKKEETDRIGCRWSGPELMKSMNVTRYIICYVILHPRYVSQFALMFSSNKRRAFYARHRSCCTSHRWIGMIKCEVHYSTSKNINVASRSHLHLSLLTFLANHCLALSCNKYNFWSDLFEINRVGFIIEKSVDIPVNKSPIGLLGPSIILLCRHVEYHKACAKRWMRTCVVQVISSIIVETIFDALDLVFTGIAFICFLVDSAISVYAGYSIHKIIACKSIIPDDWTIHILLAISKRRCTFCCKNQPLTTRRKSWNLRWLW